MESFSAQVRAEIEQIEGGLTTVFRESLQRLVAELNAMAPVGKYTHGGFLRSSLQASKTDLPEAIRENPGMADADFMAAVELVINGVEMGETIYLGYTANYATFVHFGTSKMAGRPWVTMAAQRWPSIVKEVENEVFARLGLS